MTQSNENGLTKLRAHLLEKYGQETLDRFNRNVSKTWPGHNEYPDPEDDMRTVLRRAFLWHDDDTVFWFKIYNSL